MARSTDGNPLRYWILDAEKSANERCRDSTRNSRDDYRDNRDGRNAANLFGYNGTHRNCNRFWNERKHERLADSENLCAGDNANDAYRATDNNSRENWEPRIFQGLNVSVQRNSK